MNKSDSASGDKIRVLIVDDHAMVRQGLRIFLGIFYSSEALLIRCILSLRQLKIKVYTQPSISFADLSSAIPEFLHVPTYANGCSNANQRNASNGGRITIHLRF